MASVVKRSAGVDRGVILPLELAVVRASSPQARSPLRLQHRHLVHPRRHIVSIRAVSNA